MKQINLKPVTFVQGKCGYYSQRAFQQNLLLKAMQITVDPYELRRMAGLHTVAEVYRTLDKLAIRQEYQEALAIHGLTIDNLVKGIKNALDSTKDEKVKLQIYALLLKTLGIDQYTVKDTNNDDASWELMKSLQKSIGEKEMTKDYGYETKEYEVVVPSIPKEEKIKEERERETARAIYGI